MLTPGLRSGAFSAAAPPSGIVDKRHLGEHGRQPRAAYLKGRGLDAGACRAGIMEPVKRKGPGSVDRVKRLSRVGVPGRLSWERQRDGG